MTEAKAKRGLGRGLNALFEDEETFAGGTKSAAPQTADAPPRGRATAMVAEIYPNPDQPRRDFDEEALNELAESIKAHGMLQPITVQQIKSDKGLYRIVAGERRWRAAQKAQMHEVPVHIVELSEEGVLEVALVENLQREDLNPLEEADGYARLMREYGRTHEEIGKMIGKSRPHVANMARVAAAPPKIRQYLREGKLTAGHARALLTADNGEALAELVVKKGLSVRETERLAAAKSAPNKTGRAAAARDVNTVALEEDISGVIGMKVKIDSRDGQSGVLKIEFKNLNQLDEMIARITKPAQARLND